jgi:hypothetical protein
MIRFTVHCSREKTICVMVMKLATTLKYIFPASSITFNDSPKVYGTIVTNTDCIHDNLTRGMLVSLLFRIFCLPVFSRRT